MEYEEQYRIEISTEDYRISLKEFLGWMMEVNTKSTIFFSELKEYLKESSDAQLYFIAVDFSIPVVMVKWFIQFYQEL